MLLDLRKCFLIIQENSVVWQLEDLVENFCREQNNDKTLPYHCYQSFLYWLILRVA